MKLKKGTYLIVDIGRKTNKLSEIEAEYIGLIKLSNKGGIDFRKKLLKNIAIGKTNGINIRNSYMYDFI